MKRWANMLGWVRGAATLALLTITAAAWAVGTEPGYTYKPHEGELYPPEPFSNVQIVPSPTGGPFKVGIRTDKARYSVGDKLKVSFSSNRDAHVFIFVTDAAGFTKQLFPNYYDQQNFIRAGRTYYIPDRGYDLEVVPPSGREELTIIAIDQHMPILSEWRAYSLRDPFPASREGAVALVRRLESFRREPSAMSVSALRPAPREQLWAEASASYYVMSTGSQPVSPYKVARYGSLTVDTYPNNARIYINGEHYGRSPQTIERLPIGYHNVLITKQGFLPYECRVYIQGNQTKNIDVFLRETPVEPGYSRSDKPKGIDGIGFFHR